MCASASVYALCVYVPVNASESVSDLTLFFSNIPTDGYNACIIAYGQTGSGKTFTMDGYGDMYGVNFRAVQALCDALILRKVQADAHLARAEQLREAKGGGRKSSSGSSEEAFSFELSVSMMEIYNDQVFDLLEGGGGGHGVSLDIRQVGVRIT
jgi:hypothetical protein